jgi:glycerate-2-kinase
MEEEKELLAEYAEYLLANANAAVENLKSFCRKADVNYTAVGHLETVEGHLKDISHFIGERTESLFI